MPEGARILRFPGRHRDPGFSSEEALSLARAYLEASEEQRSVTRHFLSSPDVLSALCKLLRDEWNSSPGMVAEEAPRLYCFVGEGDFEGLFDEREYFLGETALLAAGAFRLLGKREETELWLDRADSGFRHTVNPGPSLANVAYMRLALRYDMGRYQDVLELLPSLTASFERLGMRGEAAKSRLFHAATLKVTGKTREALGALEKLRNDPAVKSDSQFHGRVLVDLGDLQQLEGRIQAAIAAYQEAFAELQDGKLTGAHADLKLVIGATLRAQNQMDEALEAFRAALRDFEALEMSTRSAYLHVLIGETLLSMDRPREAEWEILQALPTIEEQKMVPEGFAAVALLRESVRQRKTDPNALRELREHLQANKA